MLDRSRVLIAEDEPLTALDVAAAIEDANGEVVGPVARVSDGIRLIAHESIDAAILDVRLLDGEVTPIAQALLAKKVVVLFHTGSDVPAGIFGHAGLCKKPTDPDHVVRTLAGHLKRR
jgi:DNA-binding response OmpR family regulator